MKKTYKPGDKLRPVVEVVKLKNDIPSVILVSGNRYVLQNNEKEENK